ncbi:MAG TPA: class I SAM-dependent methyltransferase [Sphingobacteriaceae bacterium]|nr:class I SAM-dependent methyltransferase [Sphingobacteriaceae bacterium]
MRSKKQRFGMEATMKDDAFGLYGTYYDLFYKQKNYQKESEYIIALLNSYNPAATQLLELGSGTGNYSLQLSKAGYHITGIEKSESMNYLAKFKGIDNFIPLQADMVDFKLNKEYDAAISLFDVICYLTSNADLISCFKAVSNHLKKDGVFIFDCWYSPAVYSSLPVTNVKRVETENEKIIRIAEPIITYEKNTVKVNYEFIISNKITGEVTSLEESHTLRHFNTPQIELFAELSGFKVVRSEEPVTANPPGKNTWKVCYILQKK